MVIFIGYVVMWAVGASLLNDSWSIPDVLTLYEDMSREGKPRWFLLYLYQVLIAVPLVGVHSVLELILSITEVFRLK